jgi:hypothetical protein
VDVLNILGVSMVLMGVFCWFTAGGGAEAARRRSILWSVVVAVVIGLLTPPLWTTWQPKFLPWPLESYINGVHVFHEPQHWLFPIFPWAAFAFAGLAAGFLLFSRFEREQETRFFAAVACSGVAAIGLSILLDRSPVRLYAVYDYWHASPEFLLLRCGVLLLVTAFAYAWCRWGLALKGFSPAIQFGKTSLLVYWVHIEFVYGRLSILPKHKCGIALATLGLCVIFLGMLALSLWRTRSRKRTVKALEPGNRPVAEAAT